MSSNNTTKSGATPENSNSNTTSSRGWVHFDEENSSQNRQDDSPAVLNTENVQVNLETSLNASLQENNVAVVDPKPLRNVELPVATIQPIRQGFSTFHSVVSSLHVVSIGVSIVLNNLIVVRHIFSANGDIIVTLLPVNTRFPWITPAQFRPELVPEELMAQGLTVSQFRISCKYIIYYLFQ